MSQRSKVSVPLGWRSCLGLLLLGGALAQGASLQGNGNGGAGGGGGGGGGGSTGSSKPSFGFAAAGGAIAESSASPLQVSVVLRCGAPLTKSVSFNVVDLGSGSATSGVDYVVFAPVSVVFPAGSVDGATQSVSLWPRSDQRVEGVNETVRLGFANASGGSAKGQTTYTATLQDVDLATVQFVPASSATPDERSAAHTVQVQLQLPAGTTLGCNLSVSVQDIGGGSASAGSDYSAFSSTPVSFASGTASGAQKAVALQVLDDALAEADESVRLGLASVSAGAVLGSTWVHQVTIKDDDVPTSGGAVFSATTGPTGVEGALLNGAQLELGTQPANAGPTAGTLVRVSNTGGAPLPIGAPRIVGADAANFSVTLDTAALPGGAPLPGMGEAVLSPLEVRPGAQGPGLGLALNRANLQALAGLERAVMHSFPVPGVGETTLALERVPLPFAPGAALRVDGVEVPGGLRDAVGDLSLWRGDILELPGSRVFLALSSAGSRGFLELPFPTDRFVHISVERGNPHAGRALRGPDLASIGAEVPPFECAETLSAPGGSEPQVSGSGEPGTSSLLIPADCRLALETDTQLFQKFGSTTGVVNYVTQLIGAVSAQYVEDVQASLSIAYLGVYSSGSDPWTTQESGGGTSALLSEFRTRWTGSGWPAQANLAHFISGANLGGGVAYVNVLCNQSYGFGVSGNINGTVDWGSWSGTPASFTWDFVVVAHELGHNFGSSHTHSYCPPLDICYSNCTNVTSCSQGTIMSYCHLCGGMDNIDLNFHPATADIMRQAINSSCLGMSELAPGDHVQYRVRFDPRGTLGDRYGSLQIPHGATNVPQPFAVGLHGSGN